MQREWCMQAWRKSSDEMKPRWSINAGCHLGVATIGRSSHGNCHTRQGLVEAFLPCCHWVYNSEKSRGNREAHVADGFAPPAGSEMRAAQLPWIHIYLWLFLFKVP